MTANPYRGEVAIRLGDEELVMRPTFQALVEIEERLKVGLVPLLRRISSGDYGVGDVAVIVRAGLAAAGKDRRLPDVGEAVAKAGLAVVSGPVVEFLSNAITGGAEPGEAKAAAGNT